jgi:hypothetical protein
MQEVADTPTSVTIEPIPIKKNKGGRPKKNIANFSTKNPLDGSGDTLKNEKVEEILKNVEQPRLSSTTEATIALFEHIAATEGLTEEQYEKLAGGISRGATLSQAVWYAEQFWNKKGISQKVLQKNEKIKRALAEKNLHTMVFARDSVATNVPIVVNTTLDIINKNKADIDYVQGCIRSLPPSTPLYGQLTKQLRESHNVMQSYLRIYADLLEWTEKGIRIAVEEADQDLLRRKLDQIMIDEEDNVLAEDGDEPKSDDITDTYEDDESLVSTLGDESGT